MLSESRETQSALPSPAELILHTREGKGRVEERNEEKKREMERIVQDYGRDVERELEK